MKPQTGAGRRQKRLGAEMLDQIAAEAAQQPLMAFRRDCAYHPNDVDKRLRGEEIQPD